MDGVGLSSHERVPGSSEPTAPSVHTFRLHLDSDFGSEAFVQVIRFSNESTLIWVGDKSKASGNWAVALNSIGTQFLGGDTNCEGIAVRLSKRLKKQVVASFNLTGASTAASTEIERKIVEEIKKNSHHF